MRWIAIAGLLVGCERAEDTQPPPKPDPLVGVELPEVSGAGSIAGDAAASPLVIATPIALRVDGAPVIPLRDGVVDASEKEGGALGIKIPKLTARLAAAHGPPEPAVVTLALDRRLTYKLLVEVVFSAKQREAGWKRFALLARANGKLVAFPITLPDRTPSRGISVAQFERDETSLSATDVLSKVRRSYLAGIKRCYTQLLAKQPRAAGKLTLRLTVTTSGSVTAASARGMPAMESCVTAAMATWRFPIPRDERGTATEATFETTLRFTSEDAEAEPTPPAILVQPEPQRAPLAPPPDDPANIDPRVAIAISKTELVLWSFTGLEGTLRDPKLRLARSDPNALTKLGTDLEEIVRRRWGNRTRPETTRTVVILADGAIQLQAIAELFGVARPAFPDLVLSSGFE